MPIHNVRQGEDIDGIAYEYGYHPTTLWDHADNKELKEKRENPNMLKEGDEVIVPELELGEEKVQTEQRHKFYRKGVTSALKIQFCEEDEPRADVPYIFKLKTRCETQQKDVSAKTDKDGFLKEIIPPNATEGEIILDPGENEEHIPFQLGHINPADDGCQGIQCMLNNMGYFCGNEDDELGELTIAAIREFQREKMALNEEGLLAEDTADAEDIDDDTIKAIVKAYTDEDA